MSVIRHEGESAAEDRVKQEEPDPDDLAPVDRVVLAELIV